VRLLAHLGNEATKRIESGALFKQSPMTDTRYEWQLSDRVLDTSQRSLVMGIVNVTPDSFSDGGLFAHHDAAVAHGLKLLGDGADILDIGGESSRPGALPVSLQEELERVVPVVKRLAAQVTVPISIDTCKAEVARQCLDAGAQIVNDITALAGEAAMAEVVRAAGAAVVLMHMQGTPATMQANPHYEDVVHDILHFFEARLRVLTDSGIPEARIVVDPGIGFGKTADHNLELLARLGEFQTLGRPLCLGVSRKGFLGKALQRRVDQRLAGSLAAVGYALCCRTAQIFRVHDVAQTRDVVTVFQALREKVKAQRAERGT
jgi:dihydropteroate synthase